MGDIRHLARAYKRLVNYPVELLLQILIFEKVLFGVEVRVRMNAGKSPSVHPNHWKGGQLIHFERRDGNESMQSVYARAFHHAALNYAVRRNQGTGYMLESQIHDMPMDVSKEELEAILGRISGKNLRPVKVMPEMSWKPVFNHVIAPSPPISIAFHLAALVDGPRRTLFKGANGEMKTYCSHIIRAVKCGNFEAVHREPWGMGIFPSLQYLATRAYYASHPLDDPFYVAQHSFVSGGSAKGMAEAVSKMARGHVHPREDPRRVMTAIHRMMGKNKVEIKTDPLLLDDETMARVPIESSMSGGINVGSRIGEDRFDDIIIKYVNSTDKKVSGPAVRMLSLDLLHKLEKEVRELPHLEYSKATFDPIRIVHKMSLKAESRTPGADPFKTRVIFVVTAIKTYLDRAILLPAMKRSYGVGSNKIGTKWQGGGGERFAKSLGSERSEPLGWLSLDISKFDQSVLASILMLVTFFPYFMYNKRAKNWKVVEKLLKFSIENSVVKIVKWFGKEWRMIFGLMFSGDLMTSLGDSWYLEVLLECFDMELYASMSSTDKLRFRACFRRFQDYGDDGALVYPLWVWRDYICQGTDKPMMLYNYLKEKWFMELKLSDTYIVFDDQDRPNMHVKAMFTQLGKGPCDPEVLHEGVKFLKRRLIVEVNPFSGREEYLPWRPKSDYVSKAICVAGDNQDVVLHLVRLRALALDTFGTNVPAYQFLKRIHAILFAACVRYNPESHVNAYLDKVRATAYGDLDRRDQAIVDRAGGQENMDLMYHGFPPLDQIYRRVVYDQEAQEALDQDFRTRRDKNAYELAFG